MGGGGGGVGGVGGVLLRLVNYAEPLQPDGPETMTNRVERYTFNSFGIPVIMKNVYLTTCHAFLYSN